MLLRNGFWLFKQVSLWFVMPAGLQLFSCEVPTVGAGRGVGHEAAQLLQGVDGHVQVNVATGAALIGHLLLCQGLGTAQVMTTHPPPTAHRTPE